MTNANAPEVSPDFELGAGTGTRMGTGTGTGAGFDLKLGAGKGVDTKLRAGKVRSAELLAELRLALCVLSLAGEGAEATATTLTSNRTLGLS